ncbi:PhaM family polyhydroxyalkanoate granule multifunctional regulatory protein [uncultured Dechloromonas sp.]|uniref:PhaM family polyhydroxyalkanoate granule multifunctional regulatory protein n=1 Tax=uncultured Dechloromonas sp. TaxID=171719 RepID=UPI0025F98DC1|nr:PhaM family polyhydroxyalkanoate granule multifunctional regulatory protein [uncultured Dechloromonas sp.]
MADDQVHDPLNFMRNMWGNMGFSLPGMVAPTFDVDELDKRIKDMKAVEGWLRMNLSMLQMTIQGLEMQRTTVGAVQAMGKMASDAAKSLAPDAPQPPPAAPSHFFQGVADPAHSALSDAAMWPWQMMQQMREQMQQHAEAAAQAATAATAEAAAGKPKTSRSKK